MGQVNKIQPQFGFCLVGQILGFNLGFRRPPKSGSIRQAKHAITDPGKADRQTDDDKAYSMPLLFSHPWE